jgi:hypothetical protein
MNQVETWFSIVHRKAVRRGVFRSVAGQIDLVGSYDVSLQRCEITSRCGRRLFGRRVSLVTNMCLVP